MTNAPTYEGTCFCGAVKLEVSGAPALMGYCHCEDCRHWSAGPVNGFTLWPPEAVRVTAGADKIGSYAKTERSLRKWCTVCGGHLFSEHPEMGLTDVYAAVIPEFKFEPAMHVFCKDSVLAIDDDLVRFDELPDAGAETT